VLARFCRRVILLEHSWHPRGNRRAAAAADEGDSVGEQPNSANIREAQRQALAQLTDPAMRRKVRLDARAAFKEMFPPDADTAAPVWGDDVEIKVVSNTADTLYVAIFQPDEKAALSDGQLRQVQAAGGSTGSMGSLASASTFGSVCGTASTAGSASSIGTAGSA